MSCKPCSFLILFFVEAERYVFHEDIKKLPSLLTQLAQLRANAFTYIKIVLIFLLGLVFESQVFSLFNPV